MDYVTLRGRGFEVIPDNAVGVIAFDNDKPLENIDAEYAYWLFDITEKSEGEMTLLQRQPTAHSVSSYLGAVVSVDRQTLYWVNNTKPLP